MPLAFDLNGHACDVEVLGPTITPPPPAAGAARPEKKPSRAGHRSPPQHHEQQKPKTPKAKPKPTSRTQKPAAPAPAKPGGFSLAV
jgi:hypothetical protein